MEFYFCVIVMQRGDGSDYLKVGRLGYYDSIEDINQSIIYYEYLLLYYICMNVFILL